MPNFTQVWLPIPKDLLILDEKTYKLKNKPKNYAMALWFHELFNMDEGGGDIIHHALVYYNV